MTLSKFENIPHEMRPYQQWVVWKLEERGIGKPTKIPYSPRNGNLASVNDNRSWGSFQESIDAMLNGRGLYSGIGFVLTENDPYSIIDLDVKEGSQPTTDQQAIYRDFDSYAELSPSGRGLHIICRGSLPTGKRKGPVELYSSQRYMTMTGNVWRDLPIVDCQQQLTKLWEYLGGTIAETAKLESFAQTVDDEKIIESAKAAANGQKFNSLLTGDWQNDYPSQSEADQALINIIQFYTKNHEQIARIFRASALGQRDKAKRDDYVKRMIIRAFDKELPLVNIQLVNPFDKQTEEQNKTFNLGELLYMAETEQDTQFTTDRLTPIEDVTLLAANGGVGKSFLCLQWALSISARRLFFSLHVQQSPVLFVTAEDRRKECGKRLVSICADMHLLTSNQFTKQVHENFHLWEILGSPLWIEDKNSAAGVPTNTMIELEERILATKAKQVFIDNASSVFCANHNDNVQVTAFISYLRKMAARNKCNILILAHVSADNATRGATKTYYGSTAWHNGVRSRIYMELKPPDNGIEEYISVIHEKSNYGKLAEPFKLQRNSETGVLRLLSNQEIAMSINENISNIAEQLFEDIKTIFEKGEYVNTASQGQSTTYMNLSNHFPERYKDSDKSKKNEVKLAIKKLCDERRIFKRGEFMPNGNRKDVWIPSEPTIRDQPAKSVPLIYTNSN